MNKKIEELNKIKKNKVYIQLIKLKRNLDENLSNALDLTIILSDYPYYEGDERLELSFYNIQEFKLGNINNLFRMLIDIIDISDRQLEECKYIVEELEYNTFSFQCYDFNYKII